MTKASNAGIGGANSVRHNRRPNLFRDGARRDFFGFCERHRIGVVWAQIATGSNGDRRHLERPSDWKALVAEAHRRGMQVHALDARAPPATRGRAAGRLDCLGAGRIPQRGGMARCTAAIDRRGRRNVRRRLRHSDNAAEADVRWDIAVRNEPAACGGRDCVLGISLVRGNRDSRLGRVQRLGGRGTVAVKRRGDLSS
jgi:hypothetical protein